MISENDDAQIAMERDASRINRKLDEIMPLVSQQPSTLHEAMRYSTLGGGKRIRGLLCLWANEMNGGGNAAAALEAACSLEILHAYTLVHDDLPSLDNDDLRRGKPSCHAKFGPALAILAGDALQALAFETLLSCEGPPEDLLIEATLRLARSAGSKHLVGGQVADMEFEGTSPTMEKVEFIHANKTAELISASMALGAILSGCGRAKKDRIDDIGRKIGLAFQIIDDILDIEGEADVVGKGLRKDSAKGKITYPSVIGIEESRSRAENLVNEAVKEISLFDKHEKLIFLFNLIVNRLN